MLGLASIVGVLAGLIKIFQMASTLNEIKDVLVEIRRNTQDYSPAALSAQPQEQENVMRPVGSGSEADAIIRAAMLEPER